LAYLIRRYEPETVALLSRVVPRGGVLFDVGANIGLITFSVGVRRPDISVFAFEPDPANAERWKSNFGFNAGVHAVLEEVALGDENGSVELVRGDESGWSFIAKPGVGSGVNVPLVTLDSYTAERGISSIGALKVDVEGHEPLVLHGAASLLRRQAINFIVCELEDSLLGRNGFTRHDVLSLLAGYGYTARPIPPVAGQRLRRRSLDTSRDVLFVPE
jgi:FkbM family methyltransferase